MYHRDCPWSVLYRQSLFLYKFYMITVILIMVAGIALGYLLRNRKMIFIGRFISVAIFLLLFLLGSEVGANDAIMSNLETIGFQALVITLGALIGSVLLAWVVYRNFFAR